MNLTVQHSERIYNALLSLYPSSFRVRFAPEMSQLFRDCLHDALEQGQFAIVVAFCLRTLKDLMLSVCRERKREIMRPITENPLVGIIDLLLIPSMVTANLIALGPILTLLVRGGSQTSLDQFVMTSAFFSFAVGILTILASVIITKVRPTVRLWVKLSA